MSMEETARRLREIQGREHLPDPDEYLALAVETNRTLLSEVEDIRPFDDRGFPGGLVYLDIERETIIIPDIHGRTNLLMNVFFHREPEGETVMERMARGRVQILCVGDGMHGESRAAGRWAAAKGEYLKGYRRHDRMDLEMRESMGVMEMVMVMKTAFPRSFHYLKGNHDNTMNEEGNGNPPFMKFALESLMVTRYLAQFYGTDLVRTLGSMEKNLPLLAVGERFLVSHAEPACFFPLYEVLNYRRIPEVTEGLTWTDDGYAEEGSVQLMLSEYIDPGNAARALYFGGHRPVKGLYNLRAGGRYVQIHNPHRLITARVPPFRDIDPDEDIIEIEDITAELDRKVI